MAFARLGALLLLWQVGQIKCTEDGPLRWYRLRTTVECIHDAGSPHTRLCIFHNLAIVNKKLRFMYRGRRGPTWPDITIEWNEGWHIHRQMEGMDLNHIDLKTKAARVTWVDEAVLGIAQFPGNYGHSMGEAMPNFHIRSCLAFGHCNDTADNGATFVRFEWAINLKDPSWPEMLPPVDQALRCMTNKETIHIEQDRPRHEIVILKKAAIGLGPHNRVFSDPEIREEFDSLFTDPPEWMMDDFRHRIFTCMGFHWDHLSTMPSTGKLNITLINRDDRTRHILNAKSISDAIRYNFKEDVDIVRVIRPHEMSLHQLLESLRYSSIVILTHGAAQANLLFLQKGSTVIEALWHHEEVHLHPWATTILRQAQLNTTFIGIHNREEKLGEFVKEYFVYQPNFKNLTHEEQMTYLPGGPETLHALQKKMRGVSRFQHANFYIEWPCLKQAITRAIAAIRSGTRFYDMDKLQPAGA